MKYCFIDLETTGTDPQQHGIIQIAGELWIGKGKERVLEFDHMVKPIVGKLIDDQALEINKRTRTEIEGFPAAKTVHTALVRAWGDHVSKFDRMDKMFLVAYFANFDDSFLRQWFKDLGDDYFGSWFFWPPIDVAQLALYRLRERRPHMPNFKLMTIARELGLTFDDSILHDAQADIALTRRAWETLEVMDGKGPAET